MDAEVFQGTHELDRSLRSAEKSRQQMEWFTSELRRLNLVSIVYHGRKYVLLLILFFLKDTQNYEQRI